MKRLPLLITCVALASCSFSTFAKPTEEIPLKSGLDFSAAAKLLSKYHWKPRKMHTRSGYTYIGTEKDFIERGVKGLEGCTVDSPTLCIINYKKGNLCLRVITKGELLESLKIDSWDENCPPEDAL